MQILSVRLIKLIRSLADVREHQFAHASCHEVPEHAVRAAVPQDLRRVDQEDVPADDAPEDVPDEPVDVCDTEPQVLDLSADDSNSQASPTCDPGSAAGSGRA